MSPTDPENNGLRIVPISLKIFSLVGKISTAHDVGIDQQQQFHIFHILQSDFAKSDGIKSDLRIRWSKSSGFDPKSDDSTHRIIKSKNGIGL